MTWVKQGRIFNLKQNPCRTTHAQVPTPVVFDDFIRVYYACRDSRNQSYPAYFDLSKDLRTILDVQETSVMERSNPGMFDSNGVMPSCVIRQDDDLWMYYIGWNALRGDGARYHNVIGLAVSKDGGELFQRMFDGPIMDRTPTEPGVCVMPFVMFDNGMFKMWYQSGTSWEKVGEQYEPVYVIKYAFSYDGIRWSRRPEQCVESHYKQEAFSRPCIVKNAGGYHMVYCYRNSEDYRGGNGSYKIGYARSDNGINFDRNRFELGLGEDGEFDSKMMCYPYVIEVDGKLVMFYNGNDFGQSGIGVAIWNS